MSTLYDPSVCVSILEHVPRKDANCSVLIMLCLIPSRRGGLTEPGARYGSSTNKPQRPSYLLHPSQHWDRHVKVLYFTECRRFKLRSSCLHRYSSYPLSYLLSAQKVTPTSKSWASTWLLDVVRQNRRPTVAGTLAPDRASAYSPDNLYLVHDVNLEHLTLSHLVH